MEQKNSKKAVVGVVVTMLIFGTIGIFREFTPLPSGLLSMARGLIGAAFLFAVMLISRANTKISTSKKNLILLVTSGAMIGVNWILLFEAYRYTTVATATLCYYMAPIFVIVMSSFIYKEKLTARKICCTLAALVGMVFVSGVAETGIGNIGDMRGVILGVLAAVFYSSVVLMNKSLGSVPAYDKTIVQLIGAAVVILPYCLATVDMGSLSFDKNSIIMLAIVSIVHTGISYTAYFGSMKNLQSQTIAIMSYIDPIVAVILSAVFLKEQMTILDIIGAVMILSATFLSEINLRKGQSK
jgi:drug/metabolite transporter (DMT)-like permease